MAIESREMRLRNEYFPGAEKLVFSTKGGGYSPLPIVLRKLFRHLTQPEFRVLVYLHLRTGQSGMCYPSYDEMIHELDLTSKKNLEPHLSSLEKKRFISRKRSGGKAFFLIHHPKIAIQHLLASGQIQPSELAEINELLRDLKQEPIDPNVAPVEIVQDSVMRPYPVEDPAAMASLRLPIAS